MMKEREWSALHFHLGHFSASRELLLTSVYTHERSGWGRREKQITRISPDSLTDFFISISWQRRESVVGYQISFREPFATLKPHVRYFSCSFEKRQPTQSFISKKTIENLSIWIGRERTGMATVTLVRDTSGLNSVLWSHSCKGS